MAQIHDISGNTILYISQANWLDKPAPASLDGLNAVSKFRKHIWESNVMPGPEWDILEALEGTQVTITTTIYEDRNNTNYKLYYWAIFAVLTGKHEGPNMAGVRAEFLVKV